MTKFNSFQGAECRVWKGRSRLCAHLARRFIWSRLLISNTSCGLICAYASWQVSMSHCVRGLPTLLQCSIRGLRVPGSNKTSLMGSSCWALRMWPNNLVLLFFHLVDSFVCEYLKRCSRVSMTFWFVHSLSTKVVGTRRIFLNVFICRASSRLCSACVSWMLSSPYNILDLMTASNTRSLQFTDVQACCPKGMQLFDCRLYNSNASYDFFVVIGGVGQ